MLQQVTKKVLERGSKEREERRGHSKIGEQQRRDQGVNVTVPSVPRSRCPHARRSPALTGRPALSQRLSGRGLPARTTQGRDTGCLSSTRTVEALLAICGGAVGRGDSAEHTRFLWVVIWGTEAPAFPQGNPKGPKGTFPGAHCLASRNPDAPLGEPGCGHICPKDGWPWGGLPGGAPASPPPPPLQVHQRTMSSHHEPGLHLDLPKDILSFTDIQGLVFRDHT